MRTKLMPVLICIIFLAAAQYEAVKGFSLIGEVGIDGNLYKSSNTPPVYTTVGVIYLTAKNIILDLDYAILPGTVIKF